MKDITVALELTVDSDMSDETVKVFIEDLLRSLAPTFPLRTTYAVDSHLIDVVAVCDGTFTNFAAHNQQPNWRPLEYRN